MIKQNKTKTDPWEKTEPAD